MRQICNAILKMFAQAEGNLREEGSFEENLCETAFGSNALRLYRPQCLERCLLPMRQPGRAGNVHPLVRPLGLEGFKACPGLDIPQFDGCVCTASGQVATIGAEGHRPNPVGVA